VITVLFVIAALTAYGNVAIQVAQREPGYRQRALLFLVAGWGLTACAWLS